MKDIKSSQNILEFASSSNELPMCGRYAISATPEAVRGHFSYLEQPNFPPRYNIAPTQPVPVVTQSEAARHFCLMRWGFVPGWVKDFKAFPLVINIRAETLREKPSFRAAFIRRRCLMPADGFYEWQRVGKQSQPYLLRQADGGCFAFAALHETWASPDGSEMDTVALINAHANGLISAIHSRSPVILAASDFDEWLDPGTSPDRLQRLLRPPPDALLEMLPISRMVNKVANDGVQLQQPRDPVSGFV